MKKLIIECHDCGKETVILDKYEELEQDDIKHCPLCGSENIETGDK